MRRLDLLLVALTLVLGTIWFFLRRQAPVPEPAGSVTARSSRPGLPRASGEPAAGLTVEADVRDADVFVDREYKGAVPTTSRSRVGARMRE